MFEKLLRIILLLLILPSLECGREAGKTIPPDLKDRIVYLCSGAICTIDPNGTDLKVIVPSGKGGPFSNPRWSRDKRRVAFNGETQGGARIMVVDPDGSHLKIFGLPEPKSKRPKPGVLRVERGKYDLHFGEWSPSGEYFSYSHGRMDRGYVGVMSTDGEIKTESNGSNVSFAGEDSIVFVQWFISERTAAGSRMVRWDSKEKKKQILTEGSVSPR
jgi:hypothetical protein